MLAAAFAAGCSSLPPAEAQLARCTQEDIDFLVGDAICKIVRGGMRFAHEGPRSVVNVKPVKGSTLPQCPAADALLGSMTALLRNELDASGLAIVYDEETGCAIARSGASSVLPGYILESELRMRPEEYGRGRMTDTFAFDTRLVDVKTGLVVLQNRSQIMKTR